MNTSSNDSGQGDQNGKPKPAGAAEQGHPEAERQGGDDPEPGDTANLEDGMGDAPGRATLPFNRPTPATSDEEQAQQGEDITATRSLSEADASALRQQAVMPFGGGHPAKPPAPTPAEAEPTGNESFRSTAAITDERMADLRKSPAIPFGKRRPTAKPATSTPSQPRAPATWPPTHQPTAKTAAPQEQEATPSPQKQPPGPDEEFRETASLNGDQLAALRKQVAMPFGGRRQTSAKSGEPPTAAVDPAEPPPSPNAEQQDFRSTTAIDGQQAAALRQQLPMPFPGHQSSKPHAHAQAAATTPETSSPAAKTSHTAYDGTSSLRVLNDTTIQVATMSCQLKLGQTALVVIAKGTFDLVSGGPAQLSDQADPPTGDEESVQFGSLTYPSDFAAFKAKADVVLTGHAYPPTGHSAGHAKFSFGFEGNCFTRAIAVFGERHWQKALLSLAPVDPQPFDKMPLIYERAFGGAEFTANPVGVGFKSRASKDGKARLPNLEDPQDLISSPNQTPKPMCFGPSSPRWRPGAEVLFDRHWRAGHYFRRILTGKTSSVRRLSSNSSIYVGTSPSNAWG